MNMQFTTEGGMSIKYSAHTLNELIKQKSGIDLKLQNWPSLPAGVKMVTAPGAKIKFIAADGEVLASVDGYALLTPGAKGVYIQKSKDYLTKAWLDTAFPYGQSTASKIEQADLVNQVVEKAAVKTVTLEEIASTPALSLLQKKAGETFKAHHAPQPAPQNQTIYPVLDPESPGTPILLRDAEGLYRAVRGSDSGSIYFLVLDYGDVKVAARWKLGKLSLRVEGNGLGAREKDLNEFGFGAGNTYRSIHMQAGPVPAVPKKVLGALMFTLGQPKSPLPEIERIKNKGA